MNDQLSPADVARICGVSADTIRHYERKGVIPGSERLPNGYRRFPANIVDRVRIVRSALDLGFTLDEVASLLQQRKSGAPPCRQARALAAERLHEVEQRIVELEAVRDHIRRLLVDWDQRLAGTSHGEPAHLLDSLKGDFLDASSTGPDSSASDVRLPDARAARPRNGGRPARR
ncbi:MAG: heavy metal-responsive transcriptional regulator [Thermoanaerobaculia bacterium]